MPTGTEQHPNNDELLAKAIDISQLEDDEQEEVEVMLDDELEEADDAHSSQLDTPEEELATAARNIGMLHSRKDREQLEAIDLIDDDNDPAHPKAAKKISAIGVKDSNATDEKWKRHSNTTGQGATHCRTFVSKLRYDAIEHMDEQINEWLDAHPDYEVKFSTVGVGPLIGKLKEDCLFMTVWV